MVDPDDPDRELPERCVVHVERRLHRRWHCRNALERQALVSPAGRWRDRRVVPVAVACTSVGRDPTNVGLPAAKRWNGLSWSTQSPPSIPGATDVGLGGVSCPSKRVCFAVGQYDRLQTPLGYRPLVERWNGTRWSIQQTPRTTSDLSTLSGVACTSPSDCTAVGGTNIRNHGTLVERWNGVRWSIQRTPTLRFGASHLEGVSCSSKAACVAVGWSDFRAERRMVVERWNGTAWSVQSTPAAIPGMLTGISCPSTTVCMAVGRVGNVTLAMRWHGT